MTNPRPRPALRKAADADVHPAAPRPARSPRARPVAPAPDPEPSSAPDPEPVAAVPAAAAPVPLAPPKKRSARAAKRTKPTKRMFSGSTTDHLRIPEVPEVTAGQRSALDHLFEDNGAAGESRAAKGSGKASPVQTAAKAPKTAKTAKPAKAPKPVDLMSGKPVDLEARVPKAMRKAARAEAKRRGLDVDTVVTDLLHAWLTDRP